MAITETILVFMGALATAATVGMFVSFADRWTEMVVTFLAALLWGIVGLSSFDVHAEAFGPGSEAILPLAYLGIGLAMTIGMYAAYDLVVGIGEQAADADLSDALR